MNRESSPEINIYQKDWAMLRVFPVLLIITMLFTGCGCNGGKGSLNKPAGKKLTIFEAAEQKDMETVKKILAEDPKAVNSRDDKGWTPLHYVAVKGHTSVAEYLIEKGADIEAGEKEGKTPLHIAAYNGAGEIAYLLIQNDVDLEARDNEGNTPLHVAAVMKRATAKTRFKADEKKNLTYPLSPGSEMAELLVVSGADVDARNKKGDTPLHMAVDKGFNVIVELLLKLKADVNAKDAEGRTPLHRTVLVREQQVLTQVGAGGKEEQIEEAADPGGDTASILLKKGANPNLQDKDGKTPLHYVAEYDLGEFLVPLVKAGADGSIKDKSGKTPLDYHKSTDPDEEDQRFQDMLKKAALVKKHKKK